MAQDVTPDQDVAIVVGNTEVSDAAPFPVKLQLGGSGGGGQLVASENTYLASASRTTTQTQADQSNTSGYRGVHVIVDVTDVTAGPSITVEVDAKDPASGKYYPLLASTAIVTNGTTVLKVFPGAAPQANGVADDELPKTWRIKVTANNANAGTYSVGYVLLP